MTFVVFLSFVNIIKHRKTKKHECPVNTIKTKILLYVDYNFFLLSSNLKAEGHVHCVIFFFSFLFVCMFCTVFLVLGFDFV